MRVSLGDPERLPRLLAFLALDANTVVTPISTDELEVPFLGSLNTWAQRRELELRLRTWLNAHPDAIITLTD